MNPLPPRPTRRWLVIGYGNPWRGDDGAGPELAGRVATWNLPGVTALAPHQLVPELAVPLAECDGVVFVDARAGGAAVELTPLSASPEGAGLDHRSSPAALLSLARTAYGAAPEAWLLTIPGTDFAPGRGLSRRTRQALEVAEVRLRAFLREHRAM